MIFILSIFLFPAVVAAGFSGLWEQIRPEWSFRRKVVFAAMPLPALIGLFWVMFVAGRSGLFVDGITDLTFPFSLAAFGIGAFASALMLYRRPV